MALTFSKEVMRAMGFRPFASGEAVRARFSYLKVFAIEGITVSSAEVASTTIKGYTCRLAVGSKVNDACRSLLSDDYTADEPTWQTERRCSGPYALAVIGPTDEYEASSGQIKDEEYGSITTYDCFPAAKALLRSVAGEVLPELVTALACNFFALGRHFRIRSVDEGVFGATLDNRTVHDIRITLSAHAFASISASSEVVRRSLAGTVTLAPKLNLKVARFFKLALLEEDDLKRFLYFFLALEVQTHATFGAVDHPTRISALIPSSSIANLSAAGLLKRHTDNMKNLRDRFIWCALCSWTSIDDTDVEEFKRIKDIRDAIAHGTIDSPPAEAVRAIEALTIKVLQQ